LRHLLQAGDRAGAMPPRLFLYFFIFIFLFQVTPSAPPRGRFRPPAGMKMKMKK
jgi:hypothetical protein